MQKRFLSVTLCFLTLILAGCQSEQQAAVPPPPPTVRVVRAEVKDVPVRVSALGTLVAGQTAEISPEVPGTVRVVHFVEGEEVEAGELLVELDATSFQIALRQAEASLKGVQAELDFQTDRLRGFEDLFERKVIAQVELDRQLQVVRLQAARVAEAQATVEAARHQLSLTKIRAPFKGHAGRMTVDAGNQVTAGTRLVTLRSLDRVYVDFHLPESQLAELQRVKQEGTLSVFAAAPDGGEAISGSVHFLDHHADEATGTVALRAQFGNGRHTLWPGQLVRVVLTLRVESERVVVPEQAVQVAQDGAYVLIIDEEGKAEHRHVQVGHHLDAELVLEAGVEAGEQVVIDGHLKVHPGANVEIVS